MKRTLYTLTLIVAVLATSTLSQAQNKGTNWFIGTGIGCNLVLDNAKMAPASPAGQLFVGKWFTPAFGARANVHGIMARPANPRKIWFSEDSFFGLDQLHFDGLWNFMNTFTPYKPDKVWNPALYCRVSGILASSFGTHKANVGVGGGWLNQFRLTDFMSLALDVNAVLANEKVYRTDHSGRFIFFGSATIGLVFDLTSRPTE